MWEPRRPWASLPLTSRCPGWGPPPQVPKVDTYDFKIFSLVEVSTLTENLTLLGLLGDWWVLSVGTTQAEFRL